MQKIEIKRIQSLIIIRGDFGPKKAHKFSRVLGMWELTTSTI